MQPEDALLVDPVRAHLHHRLTAAGVAHLGEHPEYVERLRRGFVGRHRARPEIVIDRADEPDPLRPVQEMLQEMSDRGLAVRAGDADDLEFAVREPVIALGHASQRGPRVGHLDKRNPAMREGDRLLRDYRHRAAVDRLVDEGRAIGAQAREGKEQVARHHATAVHRDA